MYTYIQHKYPYTSFYLLLSCSLSSLFSFLFALLYISPFSSPRNRCTNPLPYQIILHLFRNSPLFLVVIVIISDDMNIYERGGRLIEVVVGDVMGSISHTCTNKYSEPTRAGEPAGGSSCSSLLLFWWCGPLLLVFDAGGTQCALGSLRI